MGVDEELLNRFLIRTVDEGWEQTEAIHRLRCQRGTLEGLKLNEQILTVHWNVLRLLKPLAVAHRYADQLKFLSGKAHMHPFWHGDLRFVQVVDQSMDDQQLQRVGRPSADAFPDLAPSLRLAFHWK